MNPMSAIANLAKIPSRLVSVAEARQPSLNQTLAETESSATISSTTKAEKLKLDSTPSQRSIGYRATPAESDVVPTRSATLAQSSLGISNFAFPFPNGEELAPGPPGSVESSGEEPKLFFDGEQVVAYDPGNGTILGRWDAVSGDLNEEGESNPDNVQVEDVGPIPEGEFTVDPGDSNENKWWKPGWGSEESWGNVRTEIKPKSGTEVHDRDGMYMHGGEEPGSAGCVDMTGDNNDFHDWLAEQDGPVDMTVDYSKGDFDDSPELDIDSGLTIVSGPDGNERVIGPSISQDGLVTV